MSPAGPSEGGEGAEPGAGAGGESRGGATRLFLCCPDTALLHRDAAQGAGAGAGGEEDGPAPASAADLFALRGHGFSCSLSGADRDRLLTAVARWQESSALNAALLACGGGPLASFAPLEGWVSPSPSASAGDDDVGWDAERARFRFLVTGRVNRVAAEAYSSGAQTSSRYRLQRSCCDFSDVARLVSVMDVDGGQYRQLRSTAAGGTPPPAAAFETTVTRVGLDGAGAPGTGFDTLSFSDCVTRPAEKESAQERHAAASARSAGGWNAQALADAQPGMFALRHVTDALPPVSIVLGPVVGRVTLSSATMLLEFGRCARAGAAAADAVVELVLVDAVTGVRHPCRKTVRIRVPVLFAFDTLVPGRGYEIRLSNRALEGGGGGAGAEGAVGESTLGSFCTATALRATGGGGGGKKPKNALREKGGAGGGGGAGGKRWLSRFLVVGENAPSLSADAFGAPVPPAARSLVAAMALASQQSATNAAYHRVRLEEGLGLARALAELAAPVYNPIDAVIHIGGAVDLAATLEAAVTHLLAAEAAGADTHTGTGTHTPSPYCMEAESARTMFPGGAALGEGARRVGAAEEALRDAYRLHWGAASLRGLLGRGSHLFVSAPAADLLRATHTRSLQQLCGELTPVRTVLYCTALSCLLKSYLFDLLNNCCILYT
jgi:hypothetical protein